MVVDIVVIAVVGIGRLKADGSLCVELLFLCGCPRPYMTGGSNIY